MIALPVNGLVVQPCMVGNAHLLMRLPLSSYKYWWIVRCSSYRHFVLCLESNCWAAVLESLSTQLFLGSAWGKRMMLCGLTRPHPRGMELDKWTDGGGRGSSSQNGLESLNLGWCEVLSSWLLFCEGRGRHHIEWVLACSGLAPEKAIHFHSVFLKTLKVSVAC